MKKLSFASRTRDPHRLPSESVFSPWLFPRGSAPEDYFHQTGLSGGRSRGPPSRRASPYCSSSRVIRKAEQTNQGQRTVEFSTVEVVRIEDVKEKEGAEQMDKDVEQVSRNKTKVFW